MTVRLADFLAETLADMGITQVFSVTGGGAMHLNDAFGRCARLNVLYNHHEQACSTAAEGYARTSGKPAVACVTTGPGGTNAITGVLGAWLDSIPMVVISGQVKYPTTVRSSGIVGLRQLGDQEYDITRSVKPMTKYAEMIINPAEILYNVEKAVFLATHGRPGPVWLDIPLDVQSARIEPQGLRHFDACAEDLEPRPQIDPAVVDEVIRRLKQAKRPVLYAGTGIHLAHAEKVFTEFTKALGIPFGCGFSAHDLTYFDDPLYVGRPGTLGDRASNYAVQNSDVLLIIGCRLNIRQTGYSFDTFAREAFKIMVDIDPCEMVRPTLHIDLAVNADAGDFMEAVIERIDGPVDCTGWTEWCMERKRKYPVVLPEYKDSAHQVNPYYFMHELGKQLEEGAVMVASNASASICSFQAIELKRSQRIFSNSGLAQMGYGLPAAIGAAMAVDGRTVYCFEGDGSLQMCIQELETVIYNGLHLKLIVLNNDGYHSIRQTQTKFFGEMHGCTKENGVGFPDLSKLMPAYGFDFFRISDHGEFGIIAEFLAHDAPAVLEVMVTPEQAFEPKASSMQMDDGSIQSRPLEDLAPFLPREEYLSNLLIEPVESRKNG